MQKIIKTQAITLIATCLIGCDNKSNLNENISTGKDGTIVIATPSSKNKYYQPFLNDISKFQMELKKESINDSVAPIKFEDTKYDDIWIRDIAPVVTSRLVKFKYEPAYLPLKHSKSLDKIFNQWLNKEKLDVFHSKLLVDGGNVVWNKKDIIILTNRVLSDNPNFSKEEILSQLKADLKVKQVILIPPEPGDVLAHADGMVKFIDDKTIFISDFLNDDNFRKKVENVILDTIPDAKLITVKSAYTEKGQYDDDIASAKGLYINMLDTDNAIYFPQFGLPEDKEMLEFASKHVQKQVIPINVGNLSTMGGAINCLTWYYPSEFAPKKTK